MSTNFDVSVNLCGNFAECYFKLLSKLIVHGQSVSPQLKPTREIRGVQFTILDYSYNILHHNQRDLNYRFMVAEWLWIANGLDDVASISYFNKKYLQFSDDGETLYGAYGPPWVSQKDYVLRKLRRDPDSRQAIITLWKPSPPDSKDVPCTLTMHYMIRQGKLDVVVNMRSSDIYLGIPYDIFTFSQLANEIAFELKVERGNLILQIGSSHVYESDIPIISAGLISGWRALRSPPISAVMPRLVISQIMKEPGGWQNVLGLHSDTPLWRVYEVILTQPRSLTLAMLADLDQDVNNKILAKS